LREGTPSKKSCGNVHKEEKERGGDRKTSAKGSGERGIGCKGWTPGDGKTEKN